MLFIQKRQTTEFQEMRIGIPAVYYGMFRLATQWAATSKKKQQIKFSQFKESKQTQTMDINI